MIEIINVSKKYKNNVLFKNLNIQLNDKSIKIKGQNGSGKSVLLKMIVGFSMPDEGEIIVDGIKLHEDGDFIGDAGITINAPEFMKNYSGMDNLLYLAKIKGIDSMDRINELVKLFGLENDINKKYKTYSLGMKQKMRIIQALIDNPRYLILDEPFDALDKTNKALLKEYLLKYLNEDDKRQLIYTSHEEDDSFAERIYEIDDYNLKLFKW